ncbi:hypothetical protein PT285_05990 [Lactobacillus sp. ESL0791]|uniref:hypothetical protein n=1 Tax=Lactobacillus sp. ESL0791 TaxID=2983234 RepID=UPI0023F76D1F|nr:hypothetical protein [Lactobacillus sp. ESL0791]MDF7638949.1 hypothetical protein [Lactobacillus sp. ESL0791]
MKTSFKNLFSELFEQRRNLIWTFLILQIISALVSGVLCFIKGDNQIVLVHFQFGNFFLYTANLLLIFCLLYDPIFVILTAYSNEKINRSQTWRLIPASAGKIYLTNLFSSFMAVVGLTILQVISAGVFYGLAELCSEKIRQETLAKFSWSLIEANETIWLVEIIVLLVLSVTLFYLVLSFINFTSSTIVDFLPSVSGKFALYLVRLLIIILVCWLAYEILDIFIFNGPNLRTFAEIIFNGDFGNITRVNLILLIIDLILGIANVLMINKTFEAESNK